MHSGWNGTGIIDTASKLVKKKFRIDYHNLKVVIGPGIGSCCYEVDKERYGYFKKKFGIKSGVIKRNKYFVDLREANIYICAKLGIKEITIIKDCTFCNNKLSSFRRDGSDELVLMMAAIGYF